MLANLSCGHLPLCGAVRGALVRLPSDSPTPSSITRQKKTWRREARLPDRQGVLPLLKVLMLHRRVVQRHREHRRQIRALPPASKPLASLRRACPQQQSPGTLGGTATLAAPLRHLAPLEQRTDLCATTPGPASRRPEPLGAFAQRVASEQANNAPADRGLRRTCPATRGPHRGSNRCCLGEMRRILCLSRPRPANKPCDRLS